MYYYIQGELALVEPNVAVIDAGGVGYKLTVSGTTVGKLQTAENKSKVKLFTYLSVKEDALELYGFWSQEELSVFKMLISVSGIGAKSAIQILTQLSPEKFALAVAAGDTKAISKTPGVGAKTAARIVLELKDKIAKEVSVTGDDAVDYLTGEVIESNGSVIGEAAKALAVLGYTRAESDYALKGLEKSGLSLEDTIKEALKKLMKN